MKKAVFVVGTPDFQAVKRGEALLDSTYDLLGRASDEAELEADIVIAVEDEWLAGRPKAKIGMDRIREERPRVLTTIQNIAPELVVCFGPVAAASVLGKGNVTENELLRAKLTPLGEGGPPVYYTYGMENVRMSPALELWVREDVKAAAKGQTETEWGEYEIIRPGDLDWEFGPWKSMRGLEWRFTEVETVGFDLETYPGLNPWDPNARIRMAIISDRVGRAWVVQSTPGGQLPGWVKSLAEDPAVLKVGSNIKFDYRWLSRFGVNMVSFADTSTIEHVLDCTQPKKGLKHLTLRYVAKLGDYNRGIMQRIRELGGSKNDWHLLSDEDMFQYAGADGEASIGTYLGQMTRVAEADPPIDRALSLMLKIYPILARMETAGMCIDMEENKALAGKYTTYLAKLRADITKYLGPINPRSVPQLADALLRVVPNIVLRKNVLKRVLSKEDTQDEEVTTAAEVLEREAHKHPVIQSVLEFRKYATRNSTFIEGVRDRYATKHDGKYFVHTTFNTARVETFRLSSSDPAMHGTPRHDMDNPELSVKRQFVSRWPGGKILDADQSQLELRIAAWLSQDEAMLEALRSGDDIHRAMAGKMLDKPSSEVDDEERQKCKSNTFGVLYGGGQKLLARTLHISQQQAKQIISDYFRTFKGLRAYIDDVHAKAKNDLYVQTPFGFVRRFRAPESWQSTEGFHILRQAFNTPVQSSAACLVYCGMIALDRALREGGFKSLLVMQVHDSVVLDVHPDDDLDKVVQLVRTAMESGAKDVAREIAGIEITVPLVCDVKVGESWGTTQEVPRCQ